MRFVWRLVFFGALNVVMTGCASAGAAEQAETSRLRGPVVIPHRFFNASTLGACWFRREGVTYDLSELPAVDAAGPGAEDADGTPAYLGAFAHAFELPPPPPPEAPSSRRSSGSSRQRFTAAGSPSTSRDRARW